MVAQLSIVSFVTLLAVAPIEAQPPTPTGVWQDASGRVQVEIAPCDELLCGKIVWFKWPDNDQGLPLLDVKNKDPTLRARPLLGLTILDGLRRTGENTWVDGEIYDPQNGMSYQADMSIDHDGTLQVRAHQGPFGKTLTWTRMTAPGGQPSAERPPGNSG